MLINKVRICNMALRNIGLPPINSLEESGRNPKACKESYDEARVEALAAAPWGFATIWRTGVPLAIDPLPGWSYVFAYPSDFLRVHYIIPTTRGDNPPAMKVTDRPDQAGKLIHTNEAAPVFLGTRDKEDVTTFDVEFVRALSWHLSSKIAMPCTKNLKLQQSASQQFMGLVDIATAASLNEDHDDKDRLGFYHEARGQGNG